MERKWLQTALIGVLLYCSSSASAQELLGTAQAFGVLGGSTVTNTGPTVINGDLGVSPGCAVTGFPPGIVNGTIHACDAVALQAQADVTTAYNDLAGRACDTDLTGQDLGGLTLTQGVYCFSSSAQLTGNLVLDAEGSPDSEFVFQIGSTLTTASSSSVRVINGGLECNAYWQVGSSATLGTDTTFVGNILALTSITLTTDVDLAGRALARNGAVTLDTNTISLPFCSDCEFVAWLGASTVHPGDSLIVDLYLRHNKTKTVKKPFGFAIEDAQGALVGSWRWTRPLTIAYGDEVRKLFGVPVPQHLEPGVYVLRIMIGKMKQGSASERVPFKVVLEP